ncbi:alpha/beta fold hydrolase [Streptomyces sp. C11-1]|uniref:Alpha/beta fold hydrolase n=1 Tax=Streptomyces durocortorensis TaxID=2811104 RepID=A0ABY9VXM3_9ACTN|nr:alpha/beta fold hydrolase [Streptomyces durocortorensis]WNF28533.1 alpha/beta fold hydrolase [Streptomyces durocortorensis]
MLTDDGVPVEAVYEPCTAGSGAPVDAAAESLAIVVAHGFTGSADRPAVRRAARAFAQRAAVITFSFRGHGRSGGRSTVGDREVLDLAAAVAWARELGHARVVTVGFSMGGSVVLRHGALYTDVDADTDTGTRTGTADSGVPDASVRVAARERHRGRTGAHSDAVVSVSAPARWYYRGTAPMRRLHWVVTRPSGRLVGRYGLRTRIATEEWNPVPLSPVQSVPLIAPAPLLLVHGDRDPYFPLDHPRMLADAAGAGGAELWLERGMGHAENAADDALLTRIADWAVAACPIMDN